jgi:hypothetical protein
MGWLKYRVIGPGSASSTPSIGEVSTNAGGRGPTGGILPSSEEVPSWPPRLGKAQASETITRMLTINERFLRVDGFILKEDALRLIISIQSLN